MLTPNQIYDYLHYYCYINEKNTFVRNFNPIGSKNLQHLTFCESPYVDYTETNEGILRESMGCIDMYDQEPVDINAFYNDSFDEHIQNHPNSFRSTLSKEDFVFFKSQSIYAPIISHSEENSDDIAKFENRGFIPFYFWSNGILSTHWFEHYRYLKRDSVDSKFKFGVYIRDTSGTRKYRKDILEKIVDKDVYCPLVNKQIIVDSNSSASIEWKDHRLFDIHLVPETIFDTEKIHLTEKIFKPIVMYQPFIVFGGPNSLEYLKSYGFKTFDSLWDESYDLELDTNKRFERIKNLITDIKNLDSYRYNKMLSDAQNICEHNRNHFYSEGFKNELFNEFHHNLEESINIQEESFFSNPGGLLLYYQDMCFKQTKQLNNSVFPPRLDVAINNIKNKSEKVYKEVLKKYQHLF